MGDGGRLYVDPSPTVTYWSQVRGADGRTLGERMNDWVQSVPGNGLRGPRVGHYPGPTNPPQEDRMSIQIRTTEGILTLSNATDVRDTAALVVRGHKGVTLGYVAQVSTGGWIASADLESLEAYLANHPTDATEGLPLETVAAGLAR